MSPAQLAPVGLFALTMIGTPGPNNVMLTAFGAQYGYRRTLPAIAGILAGGVTLYFAVLVGLGVVFERFPAVQWSLRLVGAAYLLVLAWRIGRAPPPRFNDTAARSGWGFWQAFGFQYANPKAWVIGLTLAAVFLPDNGALWRDAGELVAVMTLVGLPCLSFWTAFGSLIGRLLTSDRAWRIFNAVMGVLTAGCVVFLFVD